ncbi:COP9 signalosome complex subunit 7, partial [Mucuna pruriens]
MEMEQKQSELIEHFVKQASAASDANAIVSVIVQASSHPNLFAFYDILSLPNLLQLEATENSVYLDMLRLFAHGTWSDYKSKADHLPQLIPDQIVKLKQLTVLTLVKTNKVLPYDRLMQELDVTNIRELEDFLIDECVYVGIIRGKLNQLRRCFEVQFAACRDMRPTQLGKSIKWADATSEIVKKHRKDVEEKVQELKKSVRKLA